MKVCNLASGSKGNSTYVKADKTEILIDAGLTLFEMETRLKIIGVEPKNIYAILITHEHSDHICSVARFAQKYDCKVYLYCDVWQAKRNKFDVIDSKKINVFYDQDFYINEMTISPVSVSHDSVHCVGFSIYFAGYKFSQVTDIGVWTNDVFEHIEGSNLVLIESNHDKQKLLDGPYAYFLKKRILSNRGHLSNEECAKAVQNLAKSGTRNFILGHLSEENNTEELAFSASAESLKIFSGQKFSIEIASQANVGRIYNMRVESDE